MAEVTEPAVRVRMSQSEKSDLVGQKKTCRCGRSITVCRGISGDWMHISDRDERCADGQLAEPRRA